MPTLFLSGPLEAIINNLTKEIGNKTGDGSELQRVWIRGQTELVEMSNTKQQLEQHLGELASQQVCGRLEL